MAATAGEVQVKITANDAGLKAGLNKAKADVSGAANAMKTSMASLRGLLGGIVAGIGIQRIGSAVMGAAVEAEDAVNKLGSALAQQGSYSKAAVKDLAEYAAAIQKVTVYDDEAIMQGQARAANLGVTSDRLKETTKAAAGLAAKLGVDISAAFTMLGKASKGNVRELGRYIPELKKAKSPQEAFNIALKVGADNFTLAENQAKGAKGQMMQFKNALGDLAEKVGALLLPAVMVMTGAMKILVDWLNEGKGWMIGVGIGIMVAIGAFMNLHKVVSTVTKSWAILTQWVVAAKTAMGDWRTWAAIVSAVGLIALAWDAAQEKLEQGYASIQNSARESWKAISDGAAAAAQQTKEEMGDAEAAIKGLSDKAGSMFKPSEKDKTLEKRTEDLYDLVEANREEAKSERERQRAMVGWSGLSDLWKKAMVAGEQERFGAKGYGVFDKTKKQLATMQGSSESTIEAPRMAFLAEIRRAEDKAALRDQKRDNLLTQIKAVLTSDQRKAASEAAF